MMAQFTAKFALEYFRSDYIDAKQKQNKTMKDEAFIALYDAAFNSADTSR